MSSLALAQVFKRNTSCMNVRIKMAIAILNGKDVAKNDK